MLQLEIYQVCLNTIYGLRIDTVIVHNNEEISIQYAQDPTVNEVGYIQQVNDRHNDTFKSLLDDLYNFTNETYKDGSFEKETLLALLNLI